MKILFFLLLGWVIIVGCREKKKEEEKPKTATESIDSMINKWFESEEESRNAYGYPALIQTDSLSATEFLPTLENVTSNAKNSIYSASFLNAWQALEKFLKHKIMVGEKNSDNFKLLTKNISSGMMETTDHSTEVSYTSDGGILVKSFFDKKIPFRHQLSNFGKPIRFINNDVEAFGIDYFFPDQAQVVKVLYFLNDQKFIIRIEASDSDQEIIFAKGVNLNGSLISTFREIEKLIQKGVSEKEDTTQQWKYRFIRNDTLAIPKISFNLENIYRDLIGEEFNTADSNLHVIVEAKQQIAFNLDENGITLQDFVSLGCDSLVRKEKHPPKKLVFDEPFFFALKYTGNNYPYFAMKIRNTELMIKK